MEERWCLHKAQRDLQVIATVRVAHRDPMEYAIAINFARNGSHCGIHEEVCQWTRKESPLGPRSQLSAQSVLLQGNFKAPNEELLYSFGKG